MSNDIDIVKFFMQATKTAPEQENTDKNREDSETAYEKAWKRFKQMDVNNQALSMSPKKVSKQSGIGQDMQGFQTPEDKKKLQDSWNEQAARDSEKAARQAQQTQQAPQTAQTTPATQPGASVQSGQASFIPATPPAQPEQPTEAKPTYRDMLTGKAPSNLTNFNKGRVSPRPGLNWNDKTKRWVKSNPDDYNVVDTILHWIHRMERKIDRARKDEDYKQFSLLMNRVNRVRDKLKNVV